MSRAKGTNPLPAKSLNDAIAEYLIACEVEGKSPRTVQAYDETLRVFRGSVASADLPTTVEGFTAADVYRFLKAITTVRSRWGLAIGGSARPGPFFLVHPHGLHAPPIPFAGIANVKWNRLRQPNSVAGCSSSSDRIPVLRKSQMIARRVELHDIDWELRRIHIRQDDSLPAPLAPFGAEPEAALRDYCSQVGSLPADLLHPRVERSRSPECSAGITSGVSRAPRHQMVMDTTGR